MAFQFHEFPHTHNYDDDLREVLYAMATLQETYDELLTQLEALRTEFEQLSDDVDAKIAAIDARVNALYTAFENVLEEFSKFQSQLNVLSTRLDNQQKEIEDINDLYNALLEAFNEYKDLVPTLIDNKINIYNKEIKKYINEIFLELYKMIEEIEKELHEKEAWRMYNRLTGITENTVDVINSYYEGLRVHCITVSEYGELQLSARKYEEFNITNIQYATMSRDMLNRYWMFSSINPFTGLNNSQNNINSWLATEHLGTISIKQYDNLEWTITEYDTKLIKVREYLSMKRDGTIERAGLITFDGAGLTVYEYDNIGSTDDPQYDYHMVIPDNGGLTVNEYDTLGKVTLPDSDDYYLIVDSTGITVNEYNVLNVA